MLATVTVVIAVTATVTMAVTGSSGAVHGAAGGGKGPSTYDGIALADAHVIAQVMQCVDVGLPAFSHGYVFDVETFLPPCAQSFGVEFFVLRCHVEDRSAVAEGQPSVAVGQELQGHIWCVIT
jgi:hypothetical protein